VFAYLDITPNLTRGAYLGRSGKSLSARQRAERGVEADATINSIRISGAAQLAWKLLDAHSNMLRIGHEDLQIKRDTASIEWPFWIPQPAKPGSYRIEVSFLQGGRVLSARESDAFRVP